MFVKENSKAGNDSWSFISGDSATAAFGTESASRRAWRELAGSLCAVASVSPGESSRHRGNHHLHHHDYQSSGDEGNEDGDDDYMAAAEAAIAALGSRVDSRCRSFRDCKPLLIHNSSGTATREFRRAPVLVNLINKHNIGKTCCWQYILKMCTLAIIAWLCLHSPHQSPLDEPVVLTDEVIFPLTVSLDKLPVSTLKVKVSVCFWVFWFLIFFNVYIAALLALWRMKFCICSLSGHGHSVEEGGWESRGAGTGLSQCSAAAWTDAHF